MFQFLRGIVWQMTRPTVLGGGAPNNMLIVASLLKPDAAALLPRQNRVRRPTPATALTTQQYRWRRRPRRDGSVDHVALASLLSAARLTVYNMLHFFVARRIIDHSRRFAAFCVVLRRFAAFYGVLRRFTAFYGVLRRVVDKFPFGVSSR